MNTHSPQNYDDTGGMTNNEDDSSVEEMYSDFKEYGMGNFKDVDDCDDEDTDSLLCPGNALEYCTINGD